METTLRIKGMVCRRCIATVKEIFMEAGYAVSHIDLGEVTYAPANPDASLDNVKKQLVEEGFEPLDDRQNRIITKVKKLVEKHLSGPEHHQHNFSEMVSEALLMDYNSVSVLFSQTEGVTLEQYLIGRRVEKVKESLLNPELSLSDIAFKLGYSSVHHLSNQFKKLTGLSPSQFRQISNVSASNTRKHTDVV